MMRQIGQIAEQMLADGTHDATALHFRLPAARQSLLYLLQQLVGDVQWVDGYDAVADWLGDNRGKGLLLIGGCGLGKTLIATRIIPHVVKALTDKMPHIFTAAALALTEVVRDAEYYRLKVIDDIGTETAYNDYGVRRYVLTEVVDRAEYRGDFLVLTTNLTAEQLKERYGTRTVDRLRAICRIVVLKGNSLRH